MRTHVYVPPTHAAQVDDVITAARPHYIIPCAAHMVFLVSPDEVDSVLTRVPALVEWIDYGVSTGASRELAGRRWIAVRFGREAAHPGVDA